MGETKVVRLRYMAEIPQRVEGPAQCASSWCRDFGAVDVQCERTVISLTAPACSTNPPGDANERYLLRGLIPAFSAAACWLALVTAARRVVVLSFSLASRFLLLVPWTQPARLDIYVFRIRIVS